MPSLRSYDELPYLSRPFPQTHPNRLGVIATLCGLTPEPVERARVLDLGCGTGGNIIPMALALPDGRFLGVDLSERQIRDGQATAQHLGLENIELRHGDILDLDQSAGTFDWIVAQGVYSWVPEQVRAHVLRVIKETLAPNGLAYVGFNALPGWLLRGHLRAQILARAKDAEERCALARRLFETLLPALRTRDDPHARLLRDVVTELSAQEDWHLRHDLLGDWNTPFTFADFQGDVEAAGLRYVGDSSFENLSLTLFQRNPGFTRGSAAHFAFEQRRDLITNRTHRGAILCHPDAPLADADWRRLEGMHVASPLGRRTRGFRFEVEGPGSTGTLRSEAGPAPAVTVALERLAQVWPGSLCFEALARETSVEELGPELLQHYATGGVELSLAPSSFALDPGERPQACPLVRRQIETGFAEVSNRKHERVPMPDGVERATLPLLDGGRDRAALAAALRADKDALDQTLAALASKALLV